MPVSLYVNSNDGPLGDLLTTRPEFPVAFPTTLTYGQSLGTPGPWGVDESGDPEDLVSFIEPYVRGLCFTYLPVTAGQEDEAVLVFCRVKQAANGNDVELTDELGYLVLATKQLVIVGTIDYAGVEPDEVFPAGWIGHPDYINGAGGLGYTSDIKIGNRLTWVVQFNESVNEFSFILDIKGQATSSNQGVVAAIPAPGSVITVGFDLIAGTVGAPVKTLSIGDATFNPRYDQSTDINSEWDPAWPPDTDGLPNPGPGPRPYTSTRLENSTITGTAVYPASVGYRGDELHCIYVKQTKDYLRTDDRSELHIDTPVDGNGIPTGAPNVTITQTSQVKESDRYEVYSTVWKTYQQEINKGPKDGLLFDQTFEYVEDTTITEADIPDGQTYLAKAGKRLCNGGIVMLRVCDAARGVVAIDYSHEEWDEERVVLNGVQGFEDRGLGIPDRPVWDTTPKSVLNADRVLHRRSLISKPVPPRYQKWPRMDRLVAHVTQDLSGEEAVDSTGVIEEDVILYTAGTYEDLAGFAIHIHTNQYDIYAHQQLQLVGVVNNVLAFDHRPQPVISLWAGLLPDDGHKTASSLTPNYRLAGQVVDTGISSAISFDSLKGTLDSPPGADLPPYVLDRYLGGQSFISTWAPYRPLYDIYGNVFIIISEGFLQHTESPDTLGNTAIELLSVMESKQIVFINGVNAQGLSPVLDNFLGDHVTPFTDTILKAPIPELRALRGAYPYQLWNPSLYI
jgi:hypothetical protein